MKQTLSVLSIILLTSISIVAQDRKQLLKARSDENLPPRSMSQIDSVIVKHQFVLEECYKEAKLTKPDLNGRLTIRLSLTPDGAVKEVGIPKDEIFSASLDSCIAIKLRRLNFTRTSPKDGIQNIDIPLNFIPDND